MCLAYVADFWQNLGYNRISSYSAYTFMNSIGYNANWNIPFGALVFFDGYGTYNGESQRVGHVGIYLGDNTFVSALGWDIVYRDITSDYWSGVYFGWQWYPGVTIEPTKCELDSNLGEDFYAVILNDACWKPISQAENSTRIFLKTENGSSRQIWRFQRQEDGTYVISSCYDGKVLEMTNGTREVCTQITAHDSYWGGAYQRWHLIPYGDGYIFLSDHFTSDGDGWAMDNYAAHSDDGNIIQINRRNNSTAQIWAVYRGDDVQLKGPILTVTPGTSLTPTRFEWTKSYGASKYNIRVFKDQLYSESDYSQWDVSSGFEMVLPAGDYIAYVDAVNYFKYKGSDIDVAFTVEEAYRVAYDAAGGTGEPEIQIKKQGISLKLSEIIPLYPDHTFMGWAAVPDGEVVYQPGDSYVKDENITLYAVWKPDRIDPDFILPDDLKTIEDEAFAGCAFQYAYLPEGTEAIGSKAFADCSNLAFIHIPESCTSIAKDAFAGVTGLTIFGQEGSCAEFYAGKYGFMFAAK